MSGLQFKKVQESICVTVNVMPLHAYNTSRALTELESRW